MTLNQLMALNSLTKADHVEVGQTLRVKGPVAATASSSPAPSFRKGASVHVVRSGESLSEIAEGYGLSMQRLVAINAIDDPNHVEVGSRLKLKGEAPAPPGSPAGGLRPPPRHSGTPPGRRDAAPRHPDQGAGHGSHHRLHCCGFGPRCDPGHGRRIQPDGRRLHHCRHHRQHAGNPGPPA